MSGYRRVKLGDILEQYRVEHIVQDGVSYRQVTISQTGTVSVRGTKEGSKIGRKRQFMFDLKNYPNTLTFIRQGVQKGGIGIAPKEVDGCIATENMPMFSISDSISTTYLKNYLKSIHFRKSLSKFKASGTAQKSIHERDLLEIELDIPDLETQLKIIDNLSDKVHLIQEIKSEIEKNKHKLNQLKQAFLQEAVQGKLTEGWRANNSNSEPASELLKRIEAEKQQLIAEKKIKKEKPLPPMGDDEIPFELPESWVWCRPSSISLAIVDCPHSTPKFKESGYDCIDTTCMDDNGRLKLHSVRKVDKDTFDKRNARLVPEANDIIYAREGSIGKSIVVPSGMNVCLGQRVMIYRLHKEVNPFLFRYELVSPMFMNKVLANHKGLGAKHVNMSDLRSMPLPLIPVEEQLVLLEKVSSLMALCDELEQQINNSQTQIEQLMQSCLKEVFEQA